MAVVTICSDFGAQKDNNKMCHSLKLAKSLQMVTAAMKLKDTYSLEGKL